MPSLTACDVSFPSALQLATSRRRLGSYLDGDAVISGDECRQCALYIENVGQRRLDALGIAWRHFLTVYGGREKVGLRLEGRRNGAIGGGKALRLPRCGTTQQAPGPGARRQGRLAPPQDPCNGAPITRGDVGPGLPPAGSSVIPTR